MGNRKFWRIVVFVIVSTVISFTIQKNNKVLAQICPGVGNYCYGSAKADIPTGCNLRDNICRTSWDEGIEYSCDQSTCSLWGMTGTMNIGSTCANEGAPPACIPQDYEVYLNCCFYGSGGGGGGGGCSATAPSNLAVNCNTARFSWGPGANAVKQYIGVSENIFDLNQPINCNPALGANCIVFEELLTSQGYYQADKNLFTNGKTYYWGVINIASPVSCSKRTLDSFNCIFPTATPTPTPWIQVNVKNSAGTAVNSSQICGVDCSGTVCVKKTGVYCSANDNSFTFPKFTTTYTYLGGRIALTDNLSQPLIVVGVTPSVVGFVETTCNGLGGYCYVWNKNSWTTGGRTVDFIVASGRQPNPTETIAVSISIFHQSYPKYDNPQGDSGHK